MYRVLFYFCLLVSTSTFAETFLVVTDDWAPYEYQSESGMVGYATDMVEEVFKELNLKNYEIKIYPWSRAVTLVKKGKAHAIYSIFETEERKEYFIYPEEVLFTSKWHFAIRKEDMEKIKYNDFQDLNAYTIGIVRDYAYDSEFLKYINKKKNFIEEATDLTLINLLHKKRVDVIIIEKNVFLTGTNNLKIDDLVLLDKELYTYELNIAFNKEKVSPSFVKQFSTKLKELKTSVKHQEIYDKYFK